jgi:hypothetical protein
MLTRATVVRTLVLGLSMFAGSQVLHMSAQSEQVTICHVPPGNPENGETITVGAKAAEAHLANHEYDMLGECPEGMGGSFESLGVFAVATAGWGLVQLYRRRRSQSV